MLLTLGFVAAIALHALKALAATTVSSGVAAKANASNSSFPTRYYSGVPLPDWDNYIQKLILVPSVITTYFTIFEP